MKDEIDVIELKEKLKDVIPLNAGGSYKLLWDMLYHIRLLKYIRQRHFKLIINKINNKPKYSKISSKKILSGLSVLGLVKNTYEDVYVSTFKSLSLLKQLGHNTSILPINLMGDGKDNEINNTEVFIQAINLPDFLFLLYPNFEYLRPDALLVRGTKEKYWLEFLEVEASKSNWNGWLENKRINYLKLAGEKRPFSYWVSHCKLLDLPIPDIKDFRFSVSIIGKIKKDFGVGFNFMEDL